MWEINLLAVAACVVAALAIGFVWYGPLFGKVWMRDWGFSESDMQGSSMVRTFGTFAVMTAIGAYILGHVLGTYGHPSVGVSVMIGLGVGLGFIATAIGGNYAFARKPLTLLMVDGGYWTVTYSAMGAILGAWR